MELFGKKLKCNVCGAEFKTQQELTAHASVHAEPAVNPTPATPQPMEQQAAQPAAPQQPAQEQALPQPQASGFKCDSCGAVFSTKDELDAHAKVHAV